jgi:hypothetical protein
LGSPPDTAGQYTTRHIHRYGWLKGGPIEQALLAEAKQRGNATKLNKTKLEQKLKDRLSQLKAKSRYALPPALTLSLPL